MFKHLSMLLYFASKNIFWAPGLSYFLYNDNLSMHNKHNNRKIKSNNSMRTGHSCAFRAGFEHCCWTGSTASQDRHLTVESQRERRAYADTRSRGMGGHPFK